MTTRIPTATGQCYFNYLSPTQIALSTHDGFALTVSNRAHLIPYAGIIFSNAGLAPNTTYNAYVYYDSAQGILKPELSTTGHGADSVSAVEVKNGDNSRTLVGMCRTNSAAQFVASAKQQFCISWFNRKWLMSNSGFLANRSITSTSYAEIDSEIRCEFLSWGYDHPVMVGGWVSSTSPGHVVDTAVGVNGSTMLANLVSRSDIAVANTAYPIGVSGVFSVVEGYNYITLLSRSPSGDAVYAGGGGAGDRCELSTLTFG